MDKRIPRLIITPGEPSGIGPDITLKIAQEQWPAELIVICDPDLLAERAKLIGLPLPNSLKIIPVKLKVASHPGQLNRDNSHYVIQCLELATDMCLEKKGDALITGPIHKSIMNDAGIAFTGHTEFLAKRCHVNDVIMLFVANKTKVALLTTHLPLSAVPKAITAKKLLHTVQLLNSELQKKFHITHPKILVCGLNPHAGENGHLGHEEIDIIIPTLHQLRAQNINVQGPFPADTLFNEKYLTNTDAILAMYHDQGLPVIKYMSFGQAVNVTLGLPIIRTSVDHGTALDIVGTQQVDSGSMRAATQLALDLSML